MELVEIKLSDCSNIKSHFFSNIENTLLVASYSGIYRHGSDGNNDGSYMFSMLAANYFNFEPLVIVVNLSSLSYEWGNTILSTLNFFGEIGRDSEEKEKSMLIVTSNLNKGYIEGLSGMITNGNRLVFDKLESALDVADSIIKKVLE